MISAYRGTAELGHGHCPNDAWRYLKQLRWSGSTALARTSYRAGIADAEPDLAGLRGFSALALKKTRKPARETVRQA